MKTISKDGTQITVCEGLELNDTVPGVVKNIPNPMIKFNGVNGSGRPDSFGMNANLLSQHLMLVGGIGSGKTNTFNQILQALIPNMTSSDVMIIFDTKGDFYKEFYQPGDVVISNDATARGPNGVDYWNILNEIEDDAHLEENIIEISKAIFADKLENTSNIFFPAAAKDIFGATLYHFIKKKNVMNSSNETISEFFGEAGIGVVNALLESYSRFRAMQSYVSPKAPEQSLGVLAELQQTIRELFVGNFAKKGTLSLRRLVREKKRRKIFIEYDIGVGSMLSPIYSLMFDLAIKEALCRNKSEGNVYFIVDEFKLLPNLHHLDDAVNFGRSLGIKFMIGIQNVDQIKEAYGEDGAMNLFSGFTNHFAFKVGDHSTREYIKLRAGSNRKKTVYRTTEVKESIETANVVEDWDVASLQLGSAIVMLNNCEPFLFRFEEFRGKRG